MLKFRGASASDSAALEVREAELVTPDLEHIALVDAPARDPHAPVGHAVGGVQILDVIRVAAVDHGSMRGRDAVVADHEIDRSSIAADHEARSLDLVVAPGMDDEQV